MNKALDKKTNASVRRFRTYPAYKESGVEWLGKTPTNWDSRRLKYCVELVNEKVDGDETSLPYTGLEHVESWTGKRISNNGVQATSDGQANRFKAGDVLFGKLRPYLAKVLRATEEGICTGELLVMRPKALNQGYLFNYLLAKDFITVVDGSTYGAKMPRASWEFIGNLPMLLPSDVEQRSIAAFLDRETSRIDQLIAKKERQIELLQEKRSALISHAVTKGLNPKAKMKDSGIEWLGEIPEHWELHGLKREIEFITSGSRGWASHYSEQGKIFIRIGNLTRDSIRLDLSDIQYVDVPQGSEGERTRVKAGDLLISITAYLGSIAVAPEDIDEAYASQHVALARPSIKRTVPKWLGYVLLSQLGKAQLEMKGYGGTKIQLGLDDVRALLITIPPIKEQREIIDYLELMVKNVEDQQNKIVESIALLREYRTALISAAVTGKIDVREEAA